MTGNTFALKDSIRRQTLELLRHMSDAERQAQSVAIQNHILELPAWQQARTAMLYMHMPHEVATDKLISCLQEAGKSIVVPKCQGDNLIPCLIDNPETDLAITPWGVREPFRDPLRIITPSELDFILIPGVAFDRQGGRIGYGRGYYDRFLAQMSGGGYVLAAAYTEQLVAWCPRQDWDYQIPRVMTEEGVILWQK
ncbi:MAG: 5-formyltetrahydrofolate cyclo-ligase [Peptococcaceae bacterium]|nr:5-formyltetrahydrofolate cyclo-ligase [Peptococcaceae bacterium]